MQEFVTLGAPWIVAVAVWFFTRNERTTFDKIIEQQRAIVEQHDKDRDYWQKRAIAAEAEIARLRSDGHRW